MYCVMGSALIGNMGVFIANVFEDAWMLCGMAENGLFPRIFALRLPRYDSPIAALLLAFVVICGLCTMEFTFIMTLNTFFSATAALLKYAAYGKLWLHRQDIKRPFRIPYITTKFRLGFFMFFPLSIATAIMLSSFFNGIAGAVTNLAGLAGGVCIFHILKKHGYIKYKTPAETISITDLVSGTHEEKLAHAYLHFPHLVEQLEPEGDCGVDGSSLLSNDKLVSSNVAPLLSPVPIMNKGTYNHKEIQAAYNYNIKKPAWEGELPSSELRPLEASS